MRFDPNQIASIVDTFGGSMQIDCLADLLTQRNPDSYPQGITEIYLSKYLCSESSLGYSKGIVSTSEALRP